MPDFSFSSPFRNRFARSRFGVRIVRRIPRRFTWRTHPAFPTGTGIFLLLSVICVFHGVFHAATVFAQDVPVTGTPVSSETRTSTPSDAGIRPVGSNDRARDIAPLIDEKTSVVVHFDLVGLDFTHLLNATIDMVERGLQDRRLDAGQVTRLRLELEKSFNYVFRDFREIRDRLLHEAGITDLYLVSYSDVSGKVPFFLAASVKDKTSQQRKAFARIVRSAFPIMFSDRGFMIAAAPVRAGIRNEAETELRARIRNLTPADPAVFHGAFSRQRESVVTFVGLFSPDDVRAMDVDAWSARFPRILVQLSKFTAERLKWVSVGFDVENSSVNVVAETGSPKDAGNILTAINRAAELGSENLGKQARENDDPQAKRQFLVLQELVRQIRTDFMPVVVREKELQIVVDAAKPKALSQILNPMLLIFMRTQQAAWFNQCIGNFQTIYQALEKYVEEKGEYPPLWTVDAEGTPLHSWRVLLLPYLDEEDLYERIRLDEPWDSEHNAQFHSKMPTIFRCPASLDATNSTATYAMIVGNDAFPPGPQAMKPEELTDAPESTVLLVEMRSPLCWMKPEDLSAEVAYGGVGAERGIGSNHLLSRERGAGVRGAVVLFFNGTPRFLTTGAPLENLKSILTFRGGEDVRLP